MAKNQPFSKGDWIVHAFYGVGQVKGIEKKVMGEEEIRYYKVDTKNSTFFLPVKLAENIRVRPVASDYRLRKVSKILKETPIPLDEKHTTRKKEISERIAEGTLESTAELIRDLSGRRVQNGLNDYDSKILSDLTDRMVLEWSISQKIEEEKAQEKIEVFIGESLEKVKVIKK